MRPQQLASAALVLALTGAGVVGAKALGERDAQRDSDHHAEVAATQIRARLDQGVALAESLRRLMVGVEGRGVTSATFASNAARWLNRAGFPAAAWIEEVPGARRGAYERRIGHPIVLRDARGTVTPVGARPSYLAATLVSGIPPLAVAGQDLGAVPGVGAALARARSLYDAGATPLTTLPDGTRGMFVIRFAPRLVSGVVTPGYVAVFVSALWLRTAATDAPALRVAVGGVGAGDLHGAEAVHRRFTLAGQRFDVAVPRRDVSGAASVLPWLILGSGVVLAGLVTALGVNGARRAQAREELDRIFRLSPDLIVVADFDGTFRRVNPAVEDILGYTAEEVLSRPYMDFVHPEDRDRTRAEASAVSEGHTARSFQNRWVRKDGSARVLEWTATPVVAERVIYSVARDVTERREAERALSRLVAEQAALSRVATLVARGVPPAELFSAIAVELEQLLEAQATAIGRVEPDGTLVVVASSGTAAGPLPVGTRFDLAADLTLTTTARTGRPGRVEDDDPAPDPRDRAIGPLGLRSNVAVPIVVEGELWGAASAGTARPRFPPDAEQRLGQFTELAAIAIANAEGRAALTASRARVVAASDETRRQIERDLHDGAQQRLVHTVVTLKMARDALAELPPNGAAALVDEALLNAERANVELRELVQGILPPVLTRGGLALATESLAGRMPLPVALDVDVGRLAPAVEATAYFVVAEALTNVVKHARARHASVTVRAAGDTLQVRVRDDGRGGARTDGGGLVGLTDRLAVLDGHLHVESPAGGGTLVAADIPLGEKA